MKTTIILSLKAKNPQGIYTVAIRFYDGKEKYIYTEHRTTREDWESPAPKRGEGSIGYQKTLTIKNALGPKMNEAVEKCGDDLTFERFKAAYEGKPLESGKTWITLLDKHIELNKTGPEKDRYSVGNYELYDYTRSILVGLEQAGLDLNVENYKTVKHYETLADWMVNTKYVNKKGKLVKRNIGPTTLAMHMQNIKAIADTGYNTELGICWVPSHDAYSRYEKPARDSGTDPNELEDFFKIKNFQLSQIPTPHKFTTQKMIAQQHQSFKRGRDFWCMMCICGGIEARTIAELRWPNVFLKANEPHFRYLREKIKKNTPTWTFVSTEDEFVQYIFEEYGIKENRFTGGYVFPILSDSMSVDQKDVAIKSFYSLITEYVGKIGNIVGTSRKPNCKSTRPTAAVIGINNGMTFNELKIFLGHKKLSTTEIYTQNQATRDKLNVSKKLAKLFREPGQLQKAS